MDRWMDSLIRFHCMPCSNRLRNLIIIAHSGLVVVVVVLVVVKGKDLSQINPHCFWDPAGRRPSRKTSACGCHQVVSTTTPPPPPPPPSPTSAMQSSIHLDKSSITYSLALANPNLTTSNNHKVQPSWRVMMIIIMTIDGVWLRQDVDKLHCIFGWKSENLSPFDWIPILLRYRPDRMEKGTRHMHKIRFLSMNDHA